MTTETILLVDDEEGIRKVLSITLADMGYKVITAADGDEAWRKFQEHRPAIVLTDIKMPGRDGVELLRLIKELDPEAEVIMVTGHGDMATAIESLKYEAADFITKPINQDVLEMSLHRVQDKIDMRREIKNYTRNLEMLVEEKSARIIELERQTAIGQVIEGMSSALDAFTSDYAPDQSIFTELPCYISVHNAYQEIVACNELFRQRFGDRIGSGSCTLYAGEAGEAKSCPVGRTFTAGAPVHMTAHVEDDSGRQIPLVVHTAPIWSEGGDVELVMEISVDVTEVNDLREELTRTRERYRSLFDEVPCYISIHNPDLTIVETNRLFKEDFGDELGDSCTLPRRKPTLDRENCLVAQTFGDGQPRQAEELVIDRDGAEINVLSATKPLYDGDGGVTQVMELAANITEVRRLQDHLVSLGMLMSSMSHGIKGMLTALDGGVYRLESGLRKRNEEQTNNALSVVKEMVERVRAMVLDILRYAKSREINWQQTSALEFARSVADVAAPKAEKAGIELVTEFDEAAGDMELDATAASAALVNLLENAVDACESDTSKDSHTIVFRMQQEDDHIHFSITDDGIGMDEKTRDKLFTLFFSSKGHKGTGLGLFIAGKVVEQHGGKIKVDSRPGEGATFHIYLPKELPQRVKQPSEEAQTLDNPE